MTPWCGACFQRNIIWAPLQLDGPSALPISCSPIRKHLFSCAINLGYASKFIGICTRKCIFSFLLPRTNHWNIPRQGNLSGCFRHCNTESWPRRLGALSFVRSLSQPELSTYWRHRSICMGKAKLTNRTHMLEMIKAISAYHGLNGVCQYYFDCHLLRPCWYLSYI